MWVPTHAYALKVRHAIDERMEKELVRVSSHSLSPEKNNAENIFCSTFDNRTKTFYVESFSTPLHPGFPHSIMYTLNIRLCLKHVHHYRLQCMCVCSSFILQLYRSLTYYTNRTTNFETKRFLSMLRILNNKYIYAYA